ncbi:MAG: recombinase family protein [Alphaproteobacteria bacterium]|nr:recombinase family protein [Alphaproteobacteria bacterium]
MVLHPSPDTLVVRWVDRLGRNYTDVTGTIRTFMNDGIVIKTIINNMTFDGSAKGPILRAVRDALIALMAADSRRVKQVQRLGIANAINDKTKDAGRKPPYDRTSYEMITVMIDQGRRDSVIAPEAGVARQTAIRIKEDRSDADEVLKRWGM